MFQKLRTDRKIGKRVGALALAFTILCTTLPAEFIHGGKVHAEEASETNVTGSPDLLVDYGKLNLKIKTADNSFYNLTYNPDTKTYDWPDGVGVTQVKEISGGIQYSIQPESQEVVANTYCTFQLPEVFKAKQVDRQDWYMDFGGESHQLGYYSVDENTNELTMHFLWDKLGEKGITVDGVQASFSASIDPSKLVGAEDNRYPLFKDVDGNALGYIEIPQVPTEISDISKSGEVQPDNSVKWTISLGTAADTGVSLAGGKLVELLDGNQTIQSAYVGDEAITFTPDPENGDLPTYTFPDNTTWTAPATVTVTTVPTEDAMSPLLSNSSNVTLSNRAQYFSRGKTEALEASAEDVTLKKATLQKDGKVIDGNTIEWYIILNENLANVYRATVMDKLSKGLSIQDDFGIQITDLTTNGSVTLNSTQKEDTLNGVALSYSDDMEDGHQVLKVNYNSIFSHKYQITFRTSVSGADFSGDATVENDATVKAFYPIGGGTGEAQEFGVPEVKTLKFNNAFIEISNTDANQQTGILSWKVNPTTKMSRADYQGGTMTLHLGDGHSYVPGSWKLVDASGEVAIASSDVTIDGATCTINLNSSIDLNKTYVTFDTKAESYFADDAKHEYVATADLKIEDGTGAYDALQATAKKSLQNNMVKKTVASSYSAYNSGNEEALFTFTIDVNANEIALTNGELTDDLSHVMYLTDCSKLGKNGSLTDMSDATPLDTKYYEIRGVETTYGSVVSDGSTDKVVKVTYDSLNQKDQVKIVVGLSSEGKEELRLDKSFKDKVIFASNEATMTADQLDGDGISHSVTGLSRGQIAINKAVEKTGTQVKDGNDYTATYTWTLDINNLGADLGSNPYIVDTIPKGLTLDKNSIHLYAAKHGTDGTLITGADTDKEIAKDATQTDCFDYTAVKQKDGSTTFTIYLPKSVTYQNGAFVLKYDTAIAGDASKYLNQAEMHVEDGTAEAKIELQVQAFSYARGSIRAFLTMTKTDELSGKAVKGAKYGIFASEEDANAGDENKTLDVGYTDGKGQITFTVKGAVSEANWKTYFIRELQVPDGTDGNGGAYELDTKVYPIANVSYGPHAIGPKGIHAEGYTGDYFVDARHKDSAKGNVDITNTFVKDQEGGKVSEFTLSVYTTDDKKNKKPVKLEQQSDGSFQFQEYGAGPRIGGSSSVLQDDDSVGSLRITGLPWGVYCLEQNKTADGFVKANPISFTIKDDGTVEGTTNVNNIKTVLTVTDNAAAEYQIEGKFVGDTTKSTRTITGAELTQNGGKVYEGEVIQGQTYILTQTKVPDGYQKHGKTESVTIGSKPELVPLKEQPIVANVKLVDQEGNPVEGAKISITAKDGSHLNDTVTPANGLKLDQQVNVDSEYELKVTLDEANKNQYLDVSKASATMSIGDGSEVFATPSQKSVMDATAEGTTVTLVVQKIYANVEILEYSDKDPKKTELLTEGTFQLYDATNDQPIRTLVTDEDDINKQDIVKLPAGSYYLKQESAPYGYDVKTEKYPFTITEKDNGTTIPIEVWNTPIPGTIVVTKSATSGTASVAGATYELYTKDADGKAVVVATKTTDVDGKMTFDGLAWNTYYLREIKAPAGYRLDTTEHSAWIIDRDHLALSKNVSDEPTQVTIVTNGYDIRDDKDEAEVTKTPIGEGVIPFSALTYEVTGIFAGETETTTREFSDDDKDGKIQVSNQFVVGNTYTFSQKSVERPYKKVEGVVAEITENHAKADGDVIEIENHMNRFAIQLLNDEGERLAGGEFALYRLKEDGTRDEKVRDITSMNHPVDLAGMEPGDYELVETKAPVVNTHYAYALDDSGLEFTLHEDNTVTVGSVNHDAMYQTEEAAEKNETKVGAKLGKENSILKMDEPVLSYVNIPTRLYFDVDVFYNETCSKEKDNTEKLAGIYYSICSKDFCVFRPISDEEDGKVVVLGLPVGDYEVSMLDSEGNNVVFNDEAYTATVTGRVFDGLKYANGAEVPKTHTKNISGEDLPVSVLEMQVYKEDLVLDKTDAEDSSKLLAGSKYRLYRKDSFTAANAVNYEAKAEEAEASEFTDFVAEAETDDNGTLTFKGVNVGVEYLVREAEEPSGYQVSKDPIMVRFVRDNKTNTTTLENLDDGDGTALIEDSKIIWKEPRLKVAVRLVDEDGNNLSGGTLTMKADADDATTRSWTTSDESELFSGVLTGGEKYTIEQTKAAEGYEPSRDVTFVAEKKALSAKDDYVQVVTVVNKKKPEEQKADPANTDAKDNNATNHSAANQSSSTAQTSGNLVSSATVTLGETDKKAPKTRDGVFSAFLQLLFGRNRQQLSKFLNK